MYSVYYKNKGIDLAAPIPLEGTIYGNCISHCNLLETFPKINLGLGDKAIAVQQ